LLDLRVNGDVPLGRSNAKLDERQLESIPVYKDEEYAENRFASTFEVENDGVTKSIDCEVLFLARNKKTGALGKSAKFASVRCGPKGGSLKPLTGGEDDAVGCRRNFNPDHEQFTVTLTLKDQ
jgi:hypothetical protein